MERIYCISGLGADERIFQNLKINNAELKFLSWPDFDQHDEIPCYAQKVAAQIPEENPIILGLSFGGMLAVEIGKIKPVKKIFLISSAKTKNDLPELSDAFKVLVKNNLVPLFIYNTPNKFLLNYFGAKTEHERTLVGDIVRDSDPRFMRWAFKAIMEWQNETYPQPLVHIHGTADQIIPPSQLHPDYWIEGGTHIMVYNRAEEISNIINSNI